MYLQKLEIQGFKSFAEKTVLEFNRSLTAVVGPNGSGKSNVADAVRWVLGEQSLKVLRGKKTEDVIFAGSNLKARLGYAEVNLWLNNQEGLAPLDYREIVITRRLYRNGESEYLINKNKVRLLDIQMLLARANFAVRTYAIIGQGMVDSILIASPAERKEFFDEATGVKEYQLKKEQAASKLEKSQTNLIQGEQLLEEIEPRLRSLTRQVKKLERKAEIEKNLLELQNNYYSHLLTDLNNQKKQTEEKLIQAEQGQTELTKQILADQQAIDNEQASDTDAQAFQKLQSQYQYYAGQKNQLQQELAVTLGKINLDLTKAGKVDLVWLKSRAEEIDRQLLELSENFKENQNSLTVAEKNLQSRLAEQRQTLAASQKLFNDQNKTSEQENLSLASVKQQLHSLYQKQWEFIDCLKKITSLSELEQLINRAEGLLANLKLLAEKITAAKRQSGKNQPELQQKLNDFLIAKDALSAEIQGIKVKLEIARQKNEYLAKERNKLEMEKKKILNELLAYDAPDSSQAAVVLKKQQTETEERIQLLENNLKKLKEELEQFSQKQATAKSKFVELQKQLRENQIKLNERGQQTTDLKIGLAKIETRIEDLEQEILNEYRGQFKPLTEAPKLEPLEALTEINRLKNQLAVIGGIDEEVAKEYQEVKKRFTFLTEQSGDLKQAIESCQTLIADLEEKIDKQFETAFQKINEQFEHYFKILFNGGQAKLLLSKKEIIEEDEILPLEGSAESTNPVKQNGQKTSPKTKKYEWGIEIKATPPGKKLKSLNVLSGGEKALTSIALISAIIANNPSPFVILDEVDAALDEANSLRFAKIVEELSRKTQFICITHNRATMHQAAILYGVTMGADSISKLLSINLSEAELSERRSGKSGPVNT